MTSLAQTTTLGRDSRALREPLTINGTYGRGAAFAAYDLTGEASVEAGVRREVAYHRFLDRSVTILRLLPAGSSRAQRYYTFVQGIHVQATLRHPSVAQVFEAGIHDELPYAVVERPHGAMLDEHLAWLAEQGAAVDTCAAIHTVDALAGLVQYAHGRGARVYNLTPANIVLADDGAPVLVQIGAAEPPEALHASEARVAFSAPELLSGRLSDHRSDIYALGALLYYTLTGRTLLPGDAQSAPLAGLPSDVDTDLLDGVIRKATARRPAARYTSVAAFRRDLARLLPEEAEVSAEDSDAEESDAEEPEELLEREVGGAAMSSARVRRPQPAPPTSEKVQVDALSGMPVQSPLDVPGADREEYRQALPYTILVPVDTAESQSPATTHASQDAIGTLSWLSVLLVVAVALGTALMLG